MVTNHVVMYIVQRALMIQFVRTSYMSAIVPHESHANAVNAM